MNKNLFFYKNRFIILYVLIGFTSILTELLVFSFLKYYFTGIVFPSFISVVLGVLIAFWLNVRYNFKISTSKRNRALFYFLLISLISYIIQITLITYFGRKFNFDYKILRLIVSGSIFWISYLFHLKYSFRDYKKVGVAIYANGVENVESIYEKIGNYIDFIHIDIVDKSFNPKASEVLSYKTEVIKAYWKNQVKETHIMSKNPKKYINKIARDVNRIYIHPDIDEDLEDTLMLIRSYNIESGIVVMNTSDINIFEKYHQLIDSVLVLCIPKPGFSGQQFNMESLDIINTINNHKYRNKISLNIDGGISSKNIPIINSENVVSGSFILKSDNPIKQIMILQTSTQYEPI